MNIVVADDHAMTRSGVATALYVMFPTAAIIECVNGEEVLDVAKAVHALLGASRVAGAGLGDRRQTACEHAAGR